MIADANHKLNQDSARNLLYDLVVNIYSVPDSLFYLACTNNNCKKKVQQMQDSKDYFC